MSLSKAPEVGIPDNSPWKDDPFGRMEHGERLLTLVRSLQGLPYVIALNGDWGTGKSTFLRRLERHFEIASPKIPFIRIDAWASDDADDPLIPFIAAINRRLSKEKSATNASKKALIDAAAKLAVPTAAMFANMIAPGSSSAIDAAAKFGQTLIDWETNRQSVTEKFQTRLADARDILTNRKKTDRISTPIVVAIDELDRCRPDFSIRALERVKHFFNVPGIVFIIATDRGNLPAAVKSVYGDAVDGELYLRKFFDYEYRLPAPSPAQYIKALWRDFDMEATLPTKSNPLHPKNALDDDKAYKAALSSQRPSLDAAEYQFYFPKVAGAFQLSLRDQAQAFTMLSAHVRTSPQTLVRLPIVDCFCVCLRFISPARFRQFQDGDLGLNISSTERDYAGISRVLGTSYGKAIQIYFSHPSVDTSIVALHEHLNNIRSTRGEAGTSPISNMQRRLEQCRISSPEYVRNLLGLLYSFAPDKEES